MELMHGGSYSSLVSLLLMELWWTRCAILQLAINYGYIIFFLGGGGGELVLFLFLTADVLSRFHG